MIGAVRKSVLIILLALIPVIVLFPGKESPFGREGALKTGDGAAFAIEEYVSESFPFKQYLTRLSAELRLACGTKESNGVFIGEESLVKDISAPGEGIAEKNTSASAALTEYAHALGKQAYFALIPTASAISAQSVPRFAEPFNQWEFIESVYGALIGKLTAVDIYPSLYTNRNQYIYYRTENNLTAYGGYHVYTALAKRMLGITEPTYNAYEINYAGREFYGNLYTAAPYNGVRPDVLIMFKYVQTDKEYIVTHRDIGGVRTYHTLFPTHTASLEEPGKNMDIYLGGLSAVVDMKMSVQGGRNLSLLVLGDETALAYLPFLVNHYSHVTFVDLSRDEGLFSDISIEDYDQILMAYSVETYASPDCLPSRAALLTE